MSADINFQSKEQDKPSPESSAALFVSLYVVILAFFILLTSNAQFDVEKTQHVVNSVNKAFSIDVVSKTDIQVKSLGNELSVTQFFEEMQSSLQSVVPLEEMKVITDGQQMRIEMEATALFNRDDPNLRYDRRNFYRRLSETATKWRKGMDMHLSMLQGVEKPVAAGANAASTLEITRGGNFARFMENRGKAPETLSIAIEQGNAGKIILIFDVLSFDREKLDFPAEEAPSSTSVPLGSVRSNP